METKSFKINIPEGFEIDKEKSTFEEIIFKPIHKKGLPKSWEELEDIDGFYVENCSVIKPFAVLGKVDEVDRNIFPTFEEAEASIALAQLCQLRDAYNEGWKPIWGKNIDYKYCIYIVNNEITVGDYRERNHVLYFKTPELRGEFVKNFKDLIEQAKPLL